MVNYQNGMIYKIAHRYSPYVYIGSTTNFNRRKSQHKDNCNNENGKAYNFKVYQTIREMGGWDNFQMVLVIKCPCDDKKELQAKEFEYQQLFDANMNTQSACSGIDPCDPEYMKKYLKSYREKYPSYRKEHYEKNPEKYKEYSKKHYEKNREEINKNRKKKVECEFCGFSLTKNNLRRHQKSISCKQQK